jgi:hypothetical protein
VGLVAQVEMGNQTKSDDEKKNTATKTKKKRGLKTAISHLNSASQEFHPQF